VLDSLDLHRHSFFNVMDRASLRVLRPFRGISPKDEG
jgi:hypothetical protein